MNSLVKTLVAGTLPALAASGLAANAPATQPGREPATQSAPIIAQSNDPLVIPDGTSIENPGPSVMPRGRPGGVDGGGFAISGIRD